MFSIYGVALLIKKINIETVMLSIVPIFLSNICLLSVYLLNYKNKWFNKPHNNNFV